MQVINQLKQEAANYDLCVIQLVEAEAEPVPEHAVTPSVKIEAIVLPATLLGSLPSFWSLFANFGRHAFRVGPLSRGF